MVKKGSSGSDRKLLNSPALSGSSRSSNTSSKSSKSSVSSKSSAISSGWPSFAELVKGKKYSFTSQQKDISNLLFDIAYSNEYLNLPIDRDFQSLKDNTWLKDDVMNAVIDGLNESGNICSQDQQKDNRFHIHQTWWMSKVLTDVSSQTEDEVMATYLLQREGLMKWHSQTKVCFAGLRFLIFPIHWKNKKVGTGWHWSYAVVNFRDHHICHFVASREAYQFIECCFDMFKTLFSRKPANTKELNDGHFMMIQYPTPNKIMITIAGFMPYWAWR